jgi:hypothetical protein
MLLLWQIGINLILVFLLNDDFFKYYSKAAFVLFPLAFAVYILLSPMVMLAAYDNPDPSAVAFGGYILPVLLGTAALSIALQAIFHFFVFNKLRRKRG